MTIHPKLAGRTCYHKYEITPGLWTPGQLVEFEPRRCLDELGIPADLSGRRALDIGAWDGPTTFELERRGAEVTALDIQDPDVTIFNAVKEILGSKARYVQGGVYDVSPEKLGQFDLVLFAGVYYHLKNPVLALQKIREVLQDDGTLYIEGASGTDWLAEHLAKELGVPRTHLAAVLDGLPLSYFDTEGKIYSHWSNWFFPTTRCLEAMLEDSGFRDVKLRLGVNAFYHHSHQRIMGSARANPTRADPTAQRYEHDVCEVEPSSDDFLSAKPKALPSYPALRKARRGLRRWLRRVVAGG